MNDITFNGLTSTLKGNLYTSPTIKKLARSFPKSNGTVGSVPFEWLRNIPRENRREFTKNLYEVFSDIVEIQRSKVFANGKCSKILKNFLVNNGIIQEKDRLMFQYLGSGDFANVVSFEVGNKKYALKIFSRKKYLEKIDSEFGNCAEQNNALYINATEYSDWTKFYFGNVFDGYMITKYVKDNAPLPRRIIKLSKKGVKFIDYDFKNIRYNINIDYGGFRKLKDFPAGNKVAMWTIGKLKDLPPEKCTEEIEKIVSNKKVPNYYDRMVGVNYVKTYILPKEKELETQKHGFWNSLIRAFMGQYKD